MKDIVNIDVCCNDPDNGFFARKAWMISWNDAEFEADDWDGYAFTEAAGFIRLHRRKFTVLTSRHSVGNWCWNRYGLSRDDAKRLLRVMADTGFWHCSCAPARIYDWFARRADVATRERLDGRAAAA